MTYPYNFIELSKDCYDYFLSLEVSEDEFNETWMAEETTYGEFLSSLKDFQSKLGYTPASGYGIYFPLDRPDWTVDFYVTDFLYGENEGCAAQTEKGYVVVYSSTQAAFGPY